jgi:hypothetical protein
LQRFRWDRYDKGAVPYIANNDEPTEIKISYVLPEPKPQEAIDVTPPRSPSPYQDAKPDPTLPQIEPPRERTHTPFGAIHEALRQHHPSYQSQTGELPPSIFDRPKSWVFLRRDTRAGSQLSCATANQP